MQRIMFDHGERRHVRLKIHAADNAPFRVKNASWELLRGKKVEIFGECEINEHIIDAYIKDPESGVTYTLRITYEINDEILVEQLELVVI